jgi:hypothetical protein
MLLLENAAEKTLLGGRQIPVEALTALRFPPGCG